MNLLDGVGNLVLQQLQAPTHVRPVWPFASFQWLKCWQLSNQPISGQSAHNIKLFGILIFSSAMIVVSAIQFLDVTKTESGTSVDREIYWVTYLLGKCLGRCSTFFIWNMLWNMLWILWILWDILWILWILWDITFFRLKSFKFCEKYCEHCEIYWVTDLLGQCLGRCSLFFRLKSCEYCEICC